MSQRRGGQKMYVKRESEMTAEDRATLRALGIERDYLGGWVTLVDARGTSFRITTDGGGEIHGFLENGAMRNFDTWFEISESFNPAYAESTHAARRFPRGFE